MNRSFRCGGSSSSYWLRGTQELSVLRRFFLSWLTIRRRFYLSCCFFRGLDFIFLQRFKTILIFQVCSD